MAYDVKNYDNLLGIYTLVDGENVELLYTQQDDAVIERSLAHNLSLNQTTTNRT
jgi:hypothetical protein